MEGSGDRPAHHQPRLCARTFSSRRCCTRSRAAWCTSRVARCSCSRTLCPSYRSCSRPSARSRASRAQGGAALAVLAPRGVAVWAPAARRDRPSGPSPPAEATACGRWRMPSTAHPTTTWSTSFHCIAERPRGVARLRARPRDQLDVDRSGGPRRVGRLRVGSRERRVRRASGTRPGWSHRATSERSLATPEGARGAGHREGTSPPSCRVLPDGDPVTSDGCAVQLLVCAGGCARSSLSSSVRSPAQPPNFA
jgi:hypothetical protein